jgi:uncharacterized protein
VVLGDCNPGITLLERVTAAPWPGSWGGDGGPAQRGSSFEASTHLLAALARPPRRELPGIRLVEPPAFDTTPERDGPICLGDVLDDAGEPAGSFGVTASTLNRHTFVAGATGSGKSPTTASRSVFRVVAR